MANALKDNPGNRETLERDLRYWSAAKASTTHAPHAAHHKHRANRVFPALVVI